MKMLKVLDNKQAEFSSHQPLLYSVRRLNTMCSVEVNIDLCNICQQLEFDISHAVSL